MSSSQNTKITIDEQLEKFFKYVSEKAANCTAPEGISKWCDKFAEDHGESEFRNKKFYNYVHSKKIEDLTYLNTLEKVQLLFVLSRPISSTFEELLIENGCSIELDMRNRICDFSSADGMFTRSGDHYAKHAKRITGNGQPNTSLIPKSPTTPTRGSPDNENGVGGADGPSTAAIKGPARKEISTHAEERIVKEEPHSEERIVKEEPMNVDDDEKERDDEERRRQDERLEQERLQIKSELDAEAQEQAEVRGSISNHKRRQESTPTEAKRARPSPRAGSELSNAPTPQASQDATSSTSQIQIINVAQLARQFETLAETFEFDDLEKSASRIRENVGNQNKTVTLDTFSIPILGILTYAKMEKVQQCQGESIKILTLFKRLRNILILPLGEKTMKKVLEVLDRKIKKLDSNKDQSVLPKEIVQTFLETLLDIFFKN